MKEHPILFKSDMARAILNCQPGVWPAEPIDPSESWKWQTRRIPTLRNSLIDGAGHSGKWWTEWWSKLDWDKAWADNGPSPAGNPGPYLHVPYPPDDTVHRIYPRVQPGDGLWVRESLRKSGAGIVTYAADALPVMRQSESVEWPWPLSARSSIFMPRWACRETLEVKAVRVERVRDISEDDAGAEGASLPCLSFSWLWDRINGKRPGCSWAENPWTWVIEFMRLPADHAEGEG